MNPKQETNINNHYDYNLANNNKLAGSDRKEWNILNKIGQNTEFLNPQIGGEFGKILRVIKKLDFLEGNYQKTKYSILKNPSLLHYHFSDLQLEP